MPRPRRCRFVKGSPLSDYFKPRGIPMRDLQEVRLSFEEFEALRLADYEGLTAIAAAEEMHVSRHTFGRVLAQARKTVADALLHGKALHIGGGTYAIKKDGAMNIIAVSSEGPLLTDMVDPRFGRAGGFVVKDARNGEISYIDNGLSQTRAQGAGIETAERLADAGVEVVLSGYVGPKAFEALQAAGIRVCQNMDGTTVEDALKCFAAGGVTFADAPNK